MPTLLQINVTANWGSTGKIAEQIGLCALAHDWDSYIAYGRWSNPSKSQLIKVGNKLDMYLHYAEQRILDNEGLCSHRATKRLIRQIEVIKPDVVQLHNIHDHYLNYRLLFEYLNGTNTQVVWTFHDCWAFTGHCFHFVTKKCMKWKAACFDCPLVHDYPNTILDRSRKNYDMKKALFSANKNLTIVACSEWMGNFVRDSFLKDKRIEVIKNGVDIRTFNFLNKPQNHRFTIIAVSSVWDEKKGLYDILKLRDTLSDEFAFVVVGLTPEQKKNLPLGITGIERTQNVQELVTLYTSADVLINPTYADNFPSVNIEALACGTPVITYQTGGSPEAVDAQTGVVVKQGDVQALAQAIIRMKEHPLSSVACRQRAEQYFDKDTCFEKYMKLYESLINE